MADDARTEARRRIAEALHAHDCGCPGYVPTSGETDPLAEREIYEGRADAVLDLFTDVVWAEDIQWPAGEYNPEADPRSAANPVPRRSKRLTLRGSVEPVVPEEPKP